MASWRTNELAEALLVPAFGAALCAAAIAFTVWEHERSRAAAIEAGRAAAGKLADALDGHIGLVVRTSEIALERVAHNHRRGAACDGVPADREPHAAAERNFGISGLLFVIDAAGWVVCANARLPESGVFAGDRDYFLALRDAPAGTLAFGAPVRSRVSQSWGLPVAMALRDARGAFAGVVATANPLEPLTEALDAVRPRPNGTAFLLTADGRRIASAPSEDDPAGAEAERAAIDAIWPAAPRGTYDTANLVPGSRRIGAFVQIADYPLAIAISASAADTLAEPMRDAHRDWWLLSAASAFVLGVCFLLGLRLRSLRLSRRAERAARMEAEAQRREILERTRRGRRLALVAENTANAVVIADPSGRIEWVNRSFERMTGWRLDEIRGKTPGAFLIGPETDHATSKLLGEAVRAHLPVLGVSIRNHAKDGRPYWNDLEIHPVRDPDGTLTGYVSLQEDTTEKRRRDAELRELHQRVALATSGSGVGIWSMDVAARKVEWDATVLELLDLSEDAARDPRAAFESRIEGADRTRFEDRLRRLVRAGEAFDIDFRIRTGGGTRRHLHAKGVPDRDETGRIVRVLGTIWDITTAKTVEASLREATRRAEAASQAKSEFLATMSHELRTPLNAIIGFSQMLECELFGPLGAPRYKGYATDIRASGELLLSLIAGALDLSKMELGHWEAAPESVDLAAIVAELNPILAEAASRRGHTLRIDVATGLTFEADPLLVKQTILNLATNAVKFTDRGGTIRIAGTRRADDAIEISVADNGIGMMPADAARAMEPFVRLHTRQRSDIPGLGIGLTIVRRIARLHGATMDIESAPGAGTAVRIAFPTRIHAGGATGMANTAE